MIPEELKFTTKEFPKQEIKSIVLVTGNLPSQVRFGLRIQEQFPERVASWIMFVNKKSRRTDSVSRWIKFKHFVKFPIRNFKTIRKLGFKRFLFGLYFEWFRKDLLNYGDNFVSNQVSFLKEEMSDMNQMKYCEPYKVKWANFADPCFEKLMTAPPYFLCSFGGPLIPQRILSAVPCAINQHAGFSPTYKGSYTIEWAIYKREFNRIGTTVHLMDSSADGGPILRRSHPYLHPTFNHYEAVIATEILGTELMIDCLNEISENESIRVYHQDVLYSRTFTSDEYTDEIKDQVIKTVRNGWLKKEIRRHKIF